MARRPKKPEQGAAAGLSFLDILCCGLGAVVLLFLIIKHGAYPAALPDLPTAAQLQTVQQVRSAVAARKNELAQLEREGAQLARQAAAERESVRALEEASGAAGRELAAILETIRKIGREQARAERLRAELDRLAEAPAPTPADPKPQHITGAVEGIRLSDRDRVAILVDVSASMLHRSLIDIIRLRNAPPGAQRSAAKWRQAMNAALWAYDSVSLGSRYKVLFYSEAVYDLSGADVSGARLQWDRKNQRSSADLLAFRRALDGFGPMAGTDLEQALRSIATLTPKPGKVLIITDGLPNRITISAASLSGRRSGCNRASFTPGGTTTSECRVSIAIASVSAHAGSLNRTPIDVILLPLDGDSRAVRFYSLLAATAGGRLLTPAPDWLIR